MRLSARSPRIIRRLRLSPEPAAVLPLVSPVPLGGAEADRFVGEQEVEQPVAAHAAVQIVPRSVVDHLASAEQAAEVGNSRIEVAAARPFSQDGVERRFIGVVNRAATDEDIVVSLAYQPILADSADKNVAACPTGQGIVAAAAKNDIVSAAAVELVVAEAAIEHVRQSAAGQGIVASAADELPRRYPSPAGTMSVSLPEEPSIMIRPTSDAENTAMTQLPCLQSSMPLGLRTISILSFLPVPIITSTFMPGFVGSSTSTAVPGATILLKSTSGAGFTVIAAVATLPPPRPASVLFKRSLDVEAGRAGEVRGRRELEARIALGERDEGAIAESASRRRSETACHW